MKEFFETWRAADQQRRYRMASVSLFEKVFRGESKSTVAMILGPPDQRPTVPDEYKAVGEIWVFFIKDPSLPKNAPEEFKVLFDTTGEYLGSEGKAD